MVFGDLKAGHDLAPHVLKMRHFPTSFRGWNIPCTNCSVVSTSADGDASFQLHIVSPRPVLRGGKEGPRGSACYSKGCVRLPLASQYTSAASLTYRVPFAPWDIPVRM
jgi:hypothetical protein